jgi:hypothetical protein
MYSDPVLGNGPERVNSKKRNKYGYVLIVICFHSVRFDEELKVCLLLQLFLLFSPLEFVLGDIH